MSFIQELQTAFLHPTKTFKNKDAKISHNILFIIILTLITTLGTIYSGYSLLLTAKTDIKNAEHNLPNFVIKDNHLETQAKKGVIYEGELINVTFNPFDKKAQKSSTWLNLEMDSNAIKVNFSKDLTEMMPASLPHQFSLPYSELASENISKTALFTSLANLATNSAIISTFIFFAFFANLFSVLFNLLIITFSGFLYTKLSKQNFTFGQDFKLCTVAYLWPCIIQTITQSIIPIPFISSLTLVFTVLIFFAIVNSKNKS